MAIVEIDVQKGEIVHNGKRMKAKKNVVMEMRKNGIRGIISGTKVYVHTADPEFVVNALVQKEYTYKELVKIAKEHGIKTKGKRKHELEKELKKIGAI